MKKNVWWIISGVVVIIAVVLLAIFAFGGKREMAKQHVSIEGTWKVVVFVENETANIIDNEYMVFDKATAKDYRDNNSEPFVSSKYVIDDTNLILADISKTYSIDSKTDNYIRLYESKTKYMDLIRYQNADMAKIQLEPDTILGNWNIIFRNTDKIYAGDYMSFDRDKISQFKAGVSDAVASADYKIIDNHLIVDGWNKEMVLYPLSDDVLIMVELTQYQGHVWELQRNK